MKLYIKQTLIVATIIGTVVAFLRMTFQLQYFDWTEFPWCIGCFIVAIVGVDYIKKQKVFQNKNALPYC